MADFYKFEIANWNEGTANLSLEQEAAYLRVVNAIRLSDQPITLNFFVLGGLWRCNERKAKRLLEELIGHGKLRVEGGLIINDKAVEAAADLCRLRADRASAGSRGGIESGKSRAKGLENKNSGEAIASTREEKRREEDIDGDGSAGAHAREADCSKPESVDADPNERSGLSCREQILDAMGVGPEGIVGPGSFVGGQSDMAEARRWLALPGLKLAIILEEIRRVADAKRDGPPKSFSYFTPALKRLSDRLVAPALPPILCPSTGSSSAGGDPLTASFARIKAEGRI